MARVKAVNYDPKTSTTTSASLIAAASEPRCSGISSRP